ncbi:uncharacterized protein LOC125120961 [Phacochoerus africanus]|uniref:uncharacterized protein LOC125120961 n=1 Tax=Phacochoerus africanus TaxID=41426 RepID=UPI001FDAC793|nr:uncharacterized protein LOC125120961 [Phacochoerus africanus]
MQARNQLMRWPAEPSGGPPAAGARGRPPVLWKRGRSLSPGRPAGPGPLPSAPVTGLPAESRRSRSRVGPAGWSLPGAVPGGGSRLCRQGCSGSPFPPARRPASSSHYKGRPRAGQPRLPAGTAAPPPPPPPPPPEGVVFVWVHLNTFSRVGAFPAHLDNQLQLPGGPRSSIRSPNPLCRGPKPPGLRVTPASGDTRRGAKDAQPTPSGRCPRCALLPAWPDGPEARRAPALQVAVSPSPQVTPKAPRTHRATCATCAAGERARSSRGGPGSHGARRRRRRRRRQHAGARERRGPGPAGLRGPTGRLEKEGALPFSPKPPTVFRSDFSY